MFIHPSNKCNNEKTANNFFEFLADTYFIAVGFARGVTCAAPKNAKLHHLTLVIQKKNKIKENSCQTRMDAEK